MAELAKSKRHTIGIVIGSVLVAAYFAVRIYLDLAARTLSGFDLWVSVLADALVVIGALWLAKYCLKTLRQLADDTPTEMYVLTDQRLLALDKAYRIRDALPLDDMDFVVTISQTSNEFHIARKSDPDSKNLFYVHLVPGLSDLKHQLETMIEAR